ncbi:MAG: Mur ligase domain-containing protein [bacterium]
MSTKIKQHLYLVGIGRVGMQWLAYWALKQGYRVSGSDLAPSLVTDRLSAKGAVIHYGVHPEQIPSDITEAIINSAITPSSPSYPELLELQRRNIPVVKRAEWTGRITKEKFTIAVCGTHGKTTTTAMIGWMMEKAGLDPTVFVGGTMKEWNHETRIGGSKYLVIEADEYDRSFHQFFPKIVVVLNIDLDHTDYYVNGLNEIKESFRKFLDNLPPDGLVVAYNGDVNIHDVVNSHHVKWYESSDIELMVPGKHNRLNAQAAMLVGEALGIERKVIEEALRSFPGVGRRFEFMGKFGSLDWYDDYGHHPTEIKATLQATREKFGNDRLVVVFQPHQRARLNALLKEFGRCFDDNHPSELVIAPLYHVAGREQDIPITHEDLGREIEKGKPVDMKLHVPNDNEEMRNMLVELSKKGGKLLTIGAGSIRGLVEGWK